MLPCAHCGATVAVGRETCKACGKRLDAPVNTDVQPVTHVEVPATPSGPPIATPTVAKAPQRKWLVLGLIGEGGTALACCGVLLLIGLVSNLTGAPRGCRRWRDHRERRCARVSAARGRCCTDRNRRTNDRVDGDAGTDRNTPAEPDRRAQPLLSGHPRHRRHRARHGVAVGVVFGGLRRRGPRNGQRIDQALHGRAEQQRGVECATGHHQAEALQRAHVPLLLDVHRCGDHTAHLVRGVPLIDDLVARPVATVVPPHQRQAGSRQPLGLYI